MKKLSMIIMVCMLAILSHAQTVDSRYTIKGDSVLSTTTVTTTTRPSSTNTAAPASAPQAQTEKPKKESSFKLSKVIIGGSLGFSFGSVTTVRINPLLGYKLTPKLSAGLTGLYEYSSYNYNNYGRQNYSNYGGSLYSRFRFIPAAYVHAEFSYINYEFSGFNNEKYRQGVPFIFLGGGFTKRLSRNTYAYGQILFDVLQDSNSPYSQWNPFYSVGVSVGF